MRAAAASLERSGRGRDGGRRHAPNKAELLDGVAETVLAQLKVDSADPSLATPLALRPIGTLRRSKPPPTLLTRGGFSGPGALHIYRALLRHAPMKPASLAPLRPHDLLNDHAPSATARCVDDLADRLRSWTWSSPARSRSVT
jgi:hypothetical protein